MKWMKGMNVRSNTMCHFEFNSPEYMEVAPEDFHFGYRENTRRCLKYDHKAYKVEVLP